MQVHIKFGWFMPALVEKTRLLLAVSDWEQVWGSVEPRHHIVTLSVNSSAARFSLWVNSPPPPPLPYAQMIEHVGQILKADPQNVMALAWSGEQLKEETGEGKGALSGRECTGMPCRATREREESGAVLCTQL